MEYWKHLTYDLEVVKERRCDGHRNSTCSPIQILEQLEVLFLQSLNSKMIFFKFVISRHDATKCKFINSVVW